MVVGLVVTYLVAHSHGSPAPAPAPAPQPAAATSPSSPYSYTLPADPAGSNCALRLWGHDATVLITSASYQVQAACDAEIKIGAHAGEVWDESPSFVVHYGHVVDPADAADSELVCDLVDQGGEAHAMVWDSGGADYGQQVCTSLLAGTWTPVGAQGS